MKTPWHSTLMQYGTAITALVVISVTALMLLTVVGIGLAITKLSILVR